MIGDAGHQHDWLMIHQPYRRVSLKRVNRVCPLPLRSGVKELMKQDGALNVLGFAIFKCPPVLLSFCVEKDIHSTAVAPRQCGCIYMDPGN